jgi:hypothetical protein
MSARVQEDSREGGQTISKSCFSFSSKFTCSKDYNTIESISEEVKGQLHLSSTCNPCITLGNKFFTGLTLPKSSITAPRVISQSFTMPPASYKQIKTQIYHMLAAVTDIYTTLQNSLGEAQQESKQNSQGFTGEFTPIYLHH